MIPRLNEGNVRYKMDAICLKEEPADSKKAQEFPLGTAKELPAGSADG
jgi:hypothetical protein